MEIKTLAALNESIAHLLCRVGVHRPLKGHHHNFIDRVSGRTVFNAKCKCGKRWMTDSPCGLLGTKVEIGKGNDQP